MVKAELSRTKKRGYVYKLHGGAGLPLNGSSRCFKASRVEERGGQVLACVDEPGGSSEVGCMASGLGLGVVASGVVGPQDSLHGAHGAMCPLARQQCVTAGALWPAVPGCLGAPSPASAAGAPAAHRAVLHN